MKLRKNIMNGEVPFDMMQSGRCQDSDLIRQKRNGRNNEARADCFKPWRIMRIPDKVYDSVNGKRVKMADILCAWADPEQSEARHIPYSKGKLRCLPACPVPASPVLFLILSPLSHSGR